MFKKWNNFWKSVQTLQINASFLLSQLKCLCVSSSYRLYLRQLCELKIVCNSEDGKFFTKLNTLKLILNSDSQQYIVLCAVSPRSYLHRLSDLHVARCNKLSLLFTNTGTEVRMFLRNDVSLLTHLGAL